MTKPEITESIERKPLSATAAWPFGDESTTAVQLDSTTWPSPNGNFVETAKWPFDTEIKEEE